MARLTGQKTAEVLARRVEVAIARSPIAALLGPRQCGKSTLAKALAQSLSLTFKLRIILQALQEGFHARNGYR